MPATRKVADKADLKSYFRRRVEPLTGRLLDVAEELCSKESEQARLEFQEHVEQQLQNGAQFVPRKRQPR